jgi:tetratricopeptide (TPR) repeat protein
VNRNEEAYENRGRSYFAKGEYPETICDYTEAIRLYPQEAETYRATDDYTVAMRLYPKLAEVYSNRAAAYRAACDEAHAASDERKAQELRK